MKILDDYINKQGVEWAKGYIQYRKEDLQRKGIKASGDLIQSLKQVILSEIEALGKSKIEIVFLEYGRFVDMKRLQAASGGGEYIQSLEKWIQQKGLLTKFSADYVRRKRAGRPPVDILNRMAWAIAIQRAKRGVKRRKWYSAPTAASITGLYNQIAAGLPDVVLNELTKQLQ